MEENRIFYNYLYLDPEKPTNYKIKGLDIILTHEPFYVGKGKNNRINHYKDNKKNLKKRFVYSKIESLKQKNLKPIAIKIISKLSEKEAQENEKYLIKVIGRRDLNKGPLCNLTDGGEGTINYIITERNRTHTGVFKKGHIPYNKGNIGLRKQPNEEKLNRANKLRGKKRTKQQIINISKSRGGAPILQYDLNGNFIKEWVGIRDVRRSHKAVNDALRKNRRMANGYLWIKKVKEEIDIKIEQYTPPKNTLNKYKNILL